MKPLVLGLGNDLISDDGIGILAAEKLKEKLVGQADVIVSNLCGVALLDLFIGYQKAVIIDAIQVGDSPPGTIIELTPENLRAIPTPSPHYSGLPELSVLAHELGLDFPDEIRILAIKITEPLKIGSGLSPPVEKSLPEVVQRAIKYVENWLEETEKSPVACCHPTVAGQSPVLLTKKVP